MSVCHVHVQGAETTFSLRLDRVQSHAELRGERVTDKNNRAASQGTQHVYLALTKALSVATTLDIKRA